MSGILFFIFASCEPLKEIKASFFRPEIPYRLEQQFPSSVGLEKKMPRIKD